MGSLFTVPVEGLTGGVSAHGCWGGATGLASQQMVTDNRQRTSISAGLRAVSAELILCYAEVTVLLYASVRRRRRAAACIRIEAPSLRCQHGGFL